VVFPEYRGVGAYFLGDAEQEKFLLQHGIRPLNILAYARSLQVGIILISLIILFYLLRRLIGTEVAFICIFLTSFAALKDAVPEPVIWYHGVEYVRIYSVKDLPEEVFIINGQ